MRSNLFGVCPSRFLYLVVNMRVKQVKVISLGAKSEDHRFYPYMVEGSPDPYKFPSDIYWFIMTSYTLPYIKETNESSFVAGYTICLLPTSSWFSHMMWS